jgi:cyclophilin family peptidyl-prolyl cis-trans isomerase
MIKKTLSILTPILFLALVYFYGGNIMGTENNKDGIKNGQEQIINENKNMKIALLKTTAGDIEIALNDKETPITVNNFISLAKKKFYDNTIFHRTIKDFMIQGGDPEGTGRGGPGYTISDELFTGDYNRGVVAMARTQEPNSAGSQFFIMHKDVPLQKDYVIFGKVIKGIEVVDKIATAPAVSNGFDSQPSKPVKPVVINSVEIIEN